MSDRSKPLTASLKVMVTVVVSPMPRRLSATTMVAVGNAVSMAKLLESVVPTPLLPEALVTPLLSRVIRLVVSVMLAVGVNVAVQVMPPSLDADVAQGAVGDGQVGVGETADRFAEGDGHQRGFAGLERGVGNDDGRGRHFGVDRVVVRVGGAGAGVAGQIADAGVVQSDQVGGVADADGRRERRRPGDAAVAADDTLLNVPLATLRSALSKPVTASLKVMVTSEVSPDADRCRP